MLVAVIEEKRSPEHGKMWWFLFYTATVLIVVATMNALVSLVLPLPIRMVFVPSGEVGVFREFGKENGGGFLEPGIHIIPGRLEAEYKTVSKSPKISEITDFQVDFIKGAAEIDAKIKWKYSDQVFKSVPSKTLFVSDEEDFQRSVFKLDIPAAMYYFDIEKGPINKEKEVSKEELAQYIKRMHYEKVDVLDVEVTSIDLIEYALQ